VKNNREKIEIIGEIVETNGKKLDQHLNPPVSMILIAGGHDNDFNKLASVEVISNDARNNIQLPDLPKTISMSSSIVNHNGAILLCGGKNNLQTCLKMEENGWNHHSYLNKERRYASAVATNTATFIFGGDESGTTYEYLEQGSSSNWQLGNEEIPDGFYGGCAIAISDEEIWLIGGIDTYSRILSFNTRNHEFTEVNTIQLKEGRIGHRCIQIPGTTKIMVTGGKDSSVLDSAEIIDFDSKSVTNTEKLNFERYFHGIGILTLDGEDQVAIFGGIKRNDDALDNFEVYDQETQKWKMTDMKLTQAKDSFGFLTVKKDDIPGL